MSLEERRRIHLLFAEVLELPGTEHAPWLDQHCGTEGPVREAIEALLAEHNQRTGLLDRPLFYPPLRSEDDVWTGQLLNSRYRVERFIARGGTSAVYLAHDQNLAGRRVIVKFLHAWVPQYLSLKARFRQEMEALARIDHPGVVGVLDTGETANGLPFLVIEYIDGVTLRGEIEGGAIPLARAANLIRQIARAVTAAHSSGVLHRDLKPENIMLERPGTADECVRLIDFGIARLREAGDDNATRTTQFAGTTPYMAPEQLRGKPCPASDIYGMAVVAYEMLAGQRPFSGAGPIEIYEQQRSGAKVNPLRQHGVPEAAAMLIVKQLAFRPEARSSSPREAGEAIASALLDPRRRALSRRHAIAALTGAGAAGASAGFIWWNWRRPLSDAERVVELPVGSEPLEHGFRYRGDIVNKAVMNRDATGVEALRFISGDQGGYYHPLNAAQSGAARRLGWKATFDATAEEGVTFCNVEIARAPARYAVNIISVPRQPDTIRLLTGYTPEIHGIEIRLPGIAGARHRYVFAQSPGSDSAELWVDGTKLYSGYGGVKEYFYERGAEIGVARYRSARGAGVFREFRFEIG